MQIKMYNEYKGKNQNKRNKKDYKPFALKKENSERIIDYF